MSDPKQIDDGGPVFPGTSLDKEVRAALLASPASYSRREASRIASHHGGITLRDYAIVHFMAALMQREDFDIETGKLTTGYSAISPRLLAAEQADAMLAARKEKA